MIEKVRRYIDLLIHYKYLVALIGVLNFLLTPIHVAVIAHQANLIIVISYTILIVTGGLLVDNVESKIRTSIFGFAALVCVWVEFSYPASSVVKWSRLLVSLLMFVNFCVLLVKQLMQIKEVNLKFIFGPFLGFVYLGIIGGVLFEIIHLLDPNSFILPNHYSGYTFYYFSFVGLTTVGYGDITPLSEPAQALSVVLNIIGQFYLIAVIGIFIGKYINEK